MKLKNITDVFFDLDHTLWDFEKNSNYAFLTIFKNHQLSFAIDDFLFHYPQINKKYWELFREDKISHSQLRYLRLKETFDLIGIIVTDEVIETISNDYILLLPTFTFLYDDTIDTLQYLSKTYKLHIITNGLSDVQFKKISNSGLNIFFTTITDSESTGAKKPNPIIFDYALKQANVLAHNTVMIGDCLQADVIGALKSGMQAIHFDEFKVFHHDETIIINKLAELKKYL